MNKYRKHIKSILVIVWIIVAERLFVTILDDRALSLLTFSIGCWMLGFAFSFLAGYMDD